MGGGEMIDMSKGLAILEVYDCDGNAPEGVTFETEGELVTEKAFYFVGSYPDRMQTSTSLSDDLSAVGTQRAVGGFSMVDPGYLTIVATLESTGDEVGRITMQIKSGWMSYGRMTAGYH
jgi:hypothetical protein